MAALVTGCWSGVRAAPAVTDAAELTAWRWQRREARAGCKGNQRRAHQEELVEGAGAAGSHWEWAGLWAGETHACCPLVAALPHFT